jgi:hypothetical protein
MMNDLGRGNWFLMFALLVLGMAVFVMATAPSWGTSSAINYTTVEGATYYHNLSNNITGYNNDVNFSIDTDTDISWTNASGTFLVSAASVSNWISITNVLTGNLTINAQYNNQTGFFVIPIQATNTSDSEFTGTNFEFIVNATNDKPNFTSSGIANSYTFPSGESTNFSLIGLDEELHYPLIYNVTFNASNCTHGSDTGYSPNSDCNLTALGLSLNYISNTTSNISFTPDATDVGTYWANISVRDAAVDFDCPHDYCDATYNTTNLTTYYSQMVLFTVSSSLTVDPSNCSGATLTQDEQFNCTIVITSPGETDSLTLSTNADFQVDASTPDNVSWFYAGDSVSASQFNYNVSISVTPGKADVGNYTINFTTVDTTLGTSNFTLIDVYVNFTEYAVTLDSISHLNGSNALYGDYSFDLNATDTDLLILDGTVKEEVLTYASNTSWVSVTSPVAGSGKDYTTSSVTIDHDAALAELGITGGNVTVKINVTDTVPVLYTDNQTFVVEIRNESAPEWDATLSDPATINFTEGTLGTYNVTINVSDVDSADTFTFFYTNISGEFCSKNDTTFNRTTGVINFTPQDCDVGYHNITIVVSDSFLNASKQFNFTVQNLADTPTFNDLYVNDNGTTITNGSAVLENEGTAISFIMIIDDDDFLIPSGQRTNFYNETLNVSVTATNSTGTVESLFDFTYEGMNTVDDSWANYSGGFTPNGNQVDNYTIFVNITDASGIGINRTFYLNISETLNSPNLTLIDNQSLTVNDYFNITANATDDEDDRDGTDLNYSIYPLGTSYPNLTIDNVTGVITFDMEGNESYAGVWGYNVTVNDSDNLGDDQVFYVSVYGNQTLNSPSTGDIFNVTENVLNFLNFTVNHSVGDNLTYEFWIDDTTCAYQNSSDCSYSNLILRESLSAYGNNTQYNWSFTANYTDETYGNLKNLSLKVYPNVTGLNSTQKDSVATYFNFSLNVTHTNSPPTAYSSFGSDVSGTYGSSTPITLTLTDNFRDYDYLDSYYLQNVTFTVSTNVSSSIIRAEEYVAANRLSWNGTMSDWSLQLYGEEAGVEQITISANDSTVTATATSFPVAFTAASSTTTPVPTPSGGGGSQTKLKHYSLKLVVPQDVIISNQNYIDIPFIIQNNGQTDLKGINLSSFVRYNDEFSDDVKISLGDSYISELKYGQSENFSMRISANTQKSGRYKATIFANVTSPKFSDWGEFFIDLRKTNETEAEQILIFTEKLVAENPECIELTELLNEAEAAFALGEYSNSLRLATEATEACEDAILANEQIKFPVAGFVRDNFYYISFSTLVIFLAGFIFYIYKRVRFNKYKVDNYV